VRVIEWIPVWYRDPSSGAIPALEFLRDVPMPVRENLLAIREAVRFSGGPHRWRDTTTHALMHGDLDFMYEARDRHGQRLYRLFMVWDRATGDLILVDGLSKENGSSIPQRDYDALAETGRVILASVPKPYATVDHLAVRLLELGTEA
jgi:hypothetical protein